MLPAALLFTIYGCDGYLVILPKLAKTYMVDRILLKEHFYKTFVKISAIA